MANKESGDGFGGGLRKKLDNAAKTAGGFAKNAAQNAGGFAQNAAKSAGGFAQNTAKSAGGFAQNAAKTAGGFAQNAAKNVKIPTVEDIREGAKDKAAIVKKSLEKKKTAAPQEQSEAPENKALSTQCALKILYYMMAADGTIAPGEEEKFDDIGREFDPEFADHKDSIIEECRAQLDQVMDPDDYFDVLRDGVEDALLASKSAEDCSVMPKLLIWDLLTVAYSDGHYDEAERKLLKYIVRKTNTDRAVFMEMESSILTLMDIEKELAWIKTTSRPYLTIEAMVNELTNRRDVIFESVKALISL